MEMLEDTAKRKEKTTYHNCSQSHTTQSQHQNYIPLIRLCSLRDGGSAGLQAASQWSQELQFLLILDQTLYTDDGTGFCDGVGCEGRLAEELGANAGTGHCGGLDEVWDGDEVQQEKAFAVRGVAGLALFARIARAEGEEHGIANCAGRH